MKKMPMDEIAFAATVLIQKEKERCKRYMAENPKDRARIRDQNQYISGINDLVNYLRDFQLNIRRED